MKISIDESALKKIKEFEELPIGKKKVRCPYHLNPKSQRANLRVLAGKGTPEEIVLETEIYAKLGGLRIDKMHEDEIRSFMQKRHIGIDCSGFVVHILDAYTLDKEKKHLWKFIRKEVSNPYQKIRYMLRPVENIGVADLTSEINSIKLQRITDIRPYDLIKTSALKQEEGLHVLMVTEVEKDSSGKTVSFKYTNSNRYYGEGNGIRFGTVIITDPISSLQAQRWLDDNDESGRNFVFDCIKKDFSKNGVYRLNFLNN
ncbi:hypothetical protein KC660_03430 [Candidatus Dojkabacteria bacterium]|uniref:Uncharacterized protein n=1 Tax=Candidatus Dojkabacteria bacterium TaxID=2099670 RepID=A0A955L3V2_9BACT|nr:hypothetical protein [Candidatus Dojkabacteria bacterium]